MLPKLFKKMPTKLQKAFEREFAYVQAEKTRFGNSVENIEKTQNAQVVYYTREHHRFLEGKLRPARQI